MEFVSPSIALKFIELCKEPSNYDKLINKRDETPIVEFAFENMRKEMRRKELVKKLTELNRKQEEDIILENLDKKQISKKNKKLKVLNNKKVAKHLIAEALREKDINKAREALLYLHKLKSRGLKQRLCKKITKKFPSLQELVTKLIGRRKKVIKKNN